MRERGAGHVPDFLRMNGMFFRGLKASQPSNGFNTWLWSWLVGFLISRLRLGVSDFQKFQMKKKNIQKQKNVSNAK